MVPESYWSCFEAEMVPESYWSCFEAAMTAMTVPTFSRRSSPRARNVDDQPPKVTPTIGGRAGQDRHCSGSR
jgi:hypothetical protein